MLLALPAAAAPLGDPVPLPAAGRVRLDVRVGTDIVQETDTRCEESSGCGATWNHSAVVGGLHIALIRGLGVYGELGLGKDQIQAAGYKGESKVWAAGVRAAVPVSQSFWIAANTRVDDGQGQGVVVADDADPEINTYRIYSGALLGVWGDSARGASMWLGAQSSWQWDHHVWPLGTRTGEVRLDVPLSPDIPASGVIGFGLNSDPMGLPWRKSGRISVAIEGRAGQELGVSGWVGVAL
jgi:hypothetical protein